MNFKMKYEPVAIMFVEDS